MTTNDTTPTVMPDTSAVVTSREHLNGLTAAVAQLTGELAEARATIAKWSEEDQRLQQKLADTEVALAEARNQTLALPDAFTDEQRARLTTITALEHKLPAAMPLGGVLTLAEWVIGGLEWSDEAEPDDGGMVRVNGTDVFMRGDVLTLRDTTDLLAEQYPDSDVLGVLRRIEPAEIRFATEPDKDGDYAELSFLNGYAVILCRQAHPERSGAVLDAAQRYGLARALLACNGIALPDTIGGE